MTRHQVWLNGRALHSMNPAIRITDVQELPPVQFVSALQRASGDGMHLLRQARQSLSVEVRFVIREYATEKRMAALQQVLTWAQPGGILTLGDRPRQRLLVTAAQLPTLQSALRWTEELSLLFTAYHGPYWEDAFPTSFTPGTLRLPGNGPAASVDFRWLTLGGSVQFCAETPLSRLCLNLSCAENQELLLTHLNGIPLLTLNGQDVLACRTPDSSDDLLLPCGTACTVRITANGQPAEGCTLSARGRWL